MAFDLDAQTFGAGDKVAPFPEIPNLGRLRCSQILE
jgi:hypothetical protein